MVKELFCQNCGYRACGNFCLQCGFRLSKDGRRVLCFECLDPLETVAGYDEDKQPYCGPCWEKRKNATPESPKRTDRDRFATRTSLNHSADDVLELGGPKTPTRSSRTPSADDLAALVAAASPSPKPMEEKHAAQNRMFGFKAFPNRVVQRPIEARSAVVKALYDKPVNRRVPQQADGLYDVGNLFYVVCFGWWLSLVYVVLAGVLYLTYFGQPYAKLAWQLHYYFFWPFGKYIVRYSTSRTFNSAHSTEYSALVNRDAPPPSSGGLVGKVIWFALAVPTLLAVHGWVTMCNWWLVVTIPMSKVHYEAMKLIVRSPIELQVTDYWPADADVLLCTHQAANRYYYKFSVGGMNVILLNLLPFVVVTLMMGYPARWAGVDPPHLIVFFCALLSVVPLSYGIGMAVSSISAQSSFAVGAILNASFGSIIELILYCQAIAKGTLTTFVQSSITGALLVTMLLLPGLGMIAGGIRNKDSQLNVLAGGVSRVLMTVSVIGAFLPTIFYMVWGSYTIDCKACIPLGETGTDCNECSFKEITLDEDDAYIHGARPLMYTVAAILPVAYLVGLLFTLKTHSHIYEAEAEAEGEDTPIWSKWKCVVILVTGAVAFSFVSDQIVESLDVALKQLNLTEEFVGLFFIGIVSSAAEILNAITFAMRDNMALAVEIGCSGTIQAVLIQMPTLVIFSAIWNHLRSIGSFTLIFPLQNLFSIFFSVIIFNYVTIDGRSNYFTGAQLVIVYTLFVAGFYFVPMSADALH
eukprot:TRINITY_DN11553_c0_g1_i1.p1 TRINITY_DN11553_c0_g1~~TRINITY_DN11553_c0_g1_i1.p1  ORF type:complete len:752 (+),score=207.93 TRINITY_DN11553_c0_g1_i1:918-3173(+)